VEGMENIEKTDTKIRGMSDIEEKAYRLIRVMKNRMNGTYEVEDLPEEEDVAEPYDDDDEMEFEND
jgi:hypothetical protein